MVVPVNLSQKMNGAKTSFASERVILCVKCVSIPKKDLIATQQLRKDIQSSYQVESILASPQCPKCDHPFLLSYKTVVIGDESATAYSQLLFITLQEMERKSKGL